MQIKTRRPPGSTLAKSVAPFANTIRRSYHVGVNALETEPTGLRPERMKRDGDSLRIDWSDGASTTITWRELRAKCPCAACGEDRKKPPDPFKVLSAQEVAAGPPAPTAMKAVGHYAYQITWNDGHSTGIYTLESLRRLSQPMKS